MPAGDAEQIAVNATHVYWTLRGSLLAADGGIARTLK
jgi:hypothetical protein